tara:strand:+ start:94 stop:201 length:108 start_codon:yes stop_codon:yes gene_type:complete
MELTITDEIMAEMYYVIIAYAFFFILAMSTKNRDL